MPAFKRTASEIQRQIDGLMAMRKTLPPVSFLSNNWEIIDGQIDVLKGLKTANYFWQDESSEDYTDGDNETYHQVHEAEMWLNGKRNEDLFELPENTFESITFDIKAIEKKIKWPVKEWAGNCYAVALKFVKHNIVKGIARYGHFTGAIHPQSIFYDKSAAGFCRHGWIELPDKSIVDPTRFVFEHREPYIYHGINDFYDIGGSSIRDKIRASTPAPAFKKEKKNLKLNLANDILNMLHVICREDRSGNEFSINQIFWIANTNPAEFGNYAKDVYKELKRVKHGEMIPIDYS